MCDGYDDEGPEVWSEQWRTARKEHRCYACRETVRPGDRYHVFRSLFDGRWSTTKHCARCWEMVEQIQNADFSNGVVELGLNCGHTWAELAGEPPPEHIAALAFWLPGDPLPNGEGVPVR